MKKARISMPLAVYLPRKTMPPVKYIINKNNERNWNPFVCKKVKAAYAEEMAPKIKDLRFILPVKLTFTLWKATLRKTDRTNVLSQHEKFACDALVEYGCLVDDNDDFIHSSHYYTGGIDRENPRVDIEIKEVEA